MRRFQLHRDEDETGFSGTGVVAEGVVFGRDRLRAVLGDTTRTAERGVSIAALHWVEWPGSIVIHAEGIDGVMAVHGHDGRTRLVWIDEP